MDVRIGYPNEHLATDSEDILSSPAYATAVGLLMEGLRKDLKEEQELIIPQEPIRTSGVEDDVENEAFLKQEAERSKRIAQQKSKSIFEKFTERFKEFLDNAE